MGETSARILRQSTPRSLSERISAGVEVGYGRRGPPAKRKVPHRRFRNAHSSFCPSSAGSKIGPLDFLLVLMPSVACAVRHKLGSSSAILCDSYLSANRFSFLFSLLFLKVL